MMNYTHSPFDVFESQKENLIPLNLNGIDTFALELSDSIGKYYAIPALDKRIQPIPDEIFGHTIWQIDFDTFNGKPAILKAYFN